MYGSWVTIHKHFSKDIQMNRHEENTMIMYCGVVAVVQKHKQAADSLAGLVACIAKFVAAIQQILDLDARQKGVFSGATKTKDATAESLIKVVLKIAGALMAYGHEKGNEQLKTECEVNKTQLRGMINTGLLAKAKIILDHAKAHAAELDAMGVGEAARSEQSSAIELFNTEYDGKESRLAARKAGRKELTDALERAGGILTKELDKLMLQMETSNPGFYHEYCAARNIRDVGIHMVKKDENGKPVEESNANSNIAAAPLVAT
jgi:hypothetical protein